MYANGLKHRRLGRKLSMQHHSNCLHSVFLDAIYEKMLQTLIVDVNIPD